MKNMKNYLLLLSVIFNLQGIFAQQSVAINNTGAVANSSAILDVSSTSKGMLLPRMTTAQRTAILNKADGLLVYDTNTNSFWFYQSSGWTELQSVSTNPWQKNGNNIYNSNTANVGIGNTIPQQKLDVSGTVKADALMIANGGNVNDVLVKTANTGTIGYRKPVYGLGLNYCIALNGIFPSRNGVIHPPDTNTVASITGIDPFIGEIALLAFNFEPKGWAFCNGQLLSINNNQALFALLGTTYGGNGINTFALPNLNDASPVHSFGGNSSWLQGESNR
jgi:microcystin-dependent protein